MHNLMEISKLFDLFNKEILLPSDFDLMDKILKHLEEQNAADGKLENYFTCRKTSDISEIFTFSYDQTRKQYILNLDDNNLKACSSYTGSEIDNDVFITVARILSHNLQSSEQAERFYRFFSSPVESVSKKKSGNKPKSRTVTNSRPSSASYSYKEFSVSFDVQRSDLKQESIECGSIITPDFSTHLAEKYIEPSYEFANDGSIHHDALDILDNIISSKAQRKYPHFVLVQSDNRIGSSFLLRKLFTDERLDPKSEEFQKKYSSFHFIWVTQDILAGTGSGTAAKLHRLLFTSKPITPKKQVILFLDNLEYLFIKTAHQKGKEVTKCIQEYFQKAYNHGYYIIATCSCDYYKYYLQPSSKYRIEGCLPKHNYIVKHWGKKQADDYQSCFSVSVHFSSKWTAIQNSGVAFDPTCIFEDCMMLPDVSTLIYYTQSSGHPTGSPCNLLLDSAYGFLHYVYQQRLAYYCLKYGRDESCHSLILRRLQDIALKLHHQNSNIFYAAEDQRIYFEDYTRDCQMQYEETQILLTFLCIDSDHYCTRHYITGFSIPWLIDYLICRTFFSCTCEQELSDLLSSKLNNCTKYLCKSQWQYANSSLKAACQKIYNYGDLETTHQLSIFEMHDIQTADASASASCRIHDENLPFLNSLLN